MHLPSQTPLRMIKEHGNQSCKSPITLILTTYTREPHTVTADLIRPFIGTRTIKNKVLLCCKRTRWHSVIGDSSIQRGGRAAVILALRQYPQGEVTTSPNQPPLFPSPLMEEESKSLSQCQALGSEGENNKALPPCHSEQSEESKISDHMTPDHHSTLDPASTKRCNASSFPRRRESITRGATPCHSEQSEESKNFVPHFHRTVILDCTRHSRVGGNPQNDA